MNNAKRDELLKRAALLLLVDWPTHAEKVAKAPGIHLIADDEQVAAIENQLTTVYRERKRLLCQTIKEFESDPNVVGENGTLLYALAVEAAVEFMREDNHA